MVKEGLAGVGAEEVVRAWVREEVVLVAWARAGKEEVVQAVAARAWVREEGVAWERAGMVEEGKAELVMEEAVVALVKVGKVGMAVVGARA